MKNALTLAVTVVALLAPLIALAQVDIQNENLGDTFGLAEATPDIQSILINIVQWVLSFLGLIAVIIIIYGGLAWMTAGGNEDRIAGAKKTISAAIIGLIIILLAWVIVTFVVVATQEATGEVEEDF